jgi:general stress protein YciG
MTITEFARLGGRARAKALSAERRRAIAKKGGEAAARVRKRKARTTK